jgi:hypothetical protein
MSGPGSLFLLRFPVPIFMVLPDNTHAGMKSVENYSITLFKNALG